MSSSYPRIIAHRCGGALAVENTLGGLRAAAGIGCRGVEFDTMLSADGVPVLMHDDTVDRTSTGRGRVAQLTLSQLRQMEVGGEPVPTLMEALDLCRSLGLWVNIEIKPNEWGGGATGDAVARCLADCWGGDGVVSSFSEDALLASRRRIGARRHALLVEAIPPDWRDLVGRLGAVAIHCSARFLDAETVAGAQAVRLPIAAYTVNDRAAADRLLAAGISAVFTDRPDLWAPGEM